MEKERRAVGEFQKINVAISKQTVKTRAALLPCILAEMSHDALARLDSRYRGTCLSAFPSNPWQALRERERYWAAPLNANQLEHRSRMIRSG
jgi:hypothetical protein